MISWSSADVSARVTFSLYSIRIYFSRETFSNAWHIFFCPPFFVIQTSPDKLRNDEKLIRGLWDHLFAFYKITSCKKARYIQKRGQSMILIAGRLLWKILDLLIWNFTLPKNKKKILFHSSFVGQFTSHKKQRRLWQAFLKICFEWLSTYTKINKNWMWFSGKNLKSSFNYFNWEGFV